MDEVYLTGVVNAEGRLDCENDIVSKLRLSPLAGKKVEVRIRKLTPRRSLAANNFYWGVIIPLLMEYTGEQTKEEQHKVLKMHFASEPHFIVNEATGEITEVKIDKSTALMDKQTFHVFIDNCIALCDELRIRLPHYEGDIYGYAEQD